MFEWIIGNPTHLFQLNSIYSAEKDEMLWKHLCEENCKDTLKDKVETLLGNNERSIKGVRTFSLPDK